MAAVELKGNSTQAVNVVELSRIDDAIATLFKRQYICTATLPVSAYRDFG